MPKLQKLPLACAVLVALLWVLPAVAQDLPDLVIHEASVEPFISTITFAPDECPVVEGCVVSGTRRLLRFATETRNIGLGDLVLGNPQDPENPYAPYYAYRECQGSYKMDGYAEYRLKDLQGSTVYGRKSAFCILDTFRFDPDATLLHRFSCQFQGIQAGWADTYSSALPCQWVDITNVPAGNYLLELEVNPEHIIVESNYENNVISVPVIIPEGGVAPANDECNDAILLQLGQTYVGNSTGATGEALSTCSLDDGRDVWFAFFPLEAANYRFTSCGSGFDSTLAVFTQCGGTPIACDDDAGACGSGARIDLELQKNTPYFVRVAGFEGASGAYLVAVSKILGTSEGEGEGEGEGVGEIYPDEVEIELGAARDATLYAESGSIANGAGEWLWAGTDDVGNVRRALLWFDLATLPPSAEITSVTLDLFATTEGPEAFCPNMTVTRITKDWSEGTANPVDPELLGAVAGAGDTTWSHAVFDVSPWSTAGADFMNWPSSGDAVGPAGMYHFQGTGLVEDVQAWLDGLQGNYGWILRGLEDESGTARPFSSREIAKEYHRPRLLLTYRIAVMHSADEDGDHRFSLSELLRVIQFYNVGAYRCSANSEDGYATEAGAIDCAPHVSDYAPQNWRIDLSELLRLIQLYNAGGYCPCAGAGTEDGYCPGIC